MDLFGLELAVVFGAADILGGTHLESLSQAGLVGDFGALIHLVVSGDLDGPDGHCHELAGGGVDVEVVIFLLGFMTTLFGQDKFGGLFALYFGAVFVTGKSLSAFL